MNDLVSVIVPVYKVEKYLDRCVESIVNQTYSNLEIILVDDGSPDNCPQMCDEWAQRDNRIKEIHKVNAGSGMARNSGLEVATGAYLMFVDSDDYLSENAIEALYTRMIQDKADMAVGKHIDIYENGKKNDAFCGWMKNVVLSRNEILEQMDSNQRIVVMACMKMYRKEVFDTIRFPALACGEDCWVFSDVMERCNKVSIVDELIYYYYQRSDSILHQLTDKRLLDDIAANLKLAKYLWKQGHEKAGRKWFVNGVDKASHLEETKQAQKIFSHFFTDEEKGELLRGTEAKTRVKWACLHSTWLLKVVRTMRTIKRRMHG